LAKQEIFAALEKNNSVIQRFLNAGLEVITHKNRINHHGLIIAGYIILDPVTGNGAYKVASGEDGLILIIIALVAALMLFVTVSGAGQALFLALCLSSGPALAGSIKKSKTLLEYLEQAKKIIVSCHNAGFALAALVVVAFFALALYRIAGWLLTIAQAMALFCSKRKKACTSFLMMFLALPLLSKLGEKADETIDWMIKNCKEPIDVGNGGDI
jgi:hypothetical protein